MISCVFALLLIIITLPSSKLKETTIQNLHHLPVVTLVNYEPTSITFFIIHLFLFYHLIIVLNHVSVIGNFFSDKIHKLHTNLLLKANYSSHTDLPSIPVDLSNFLPVTLDEVSKLLCLSPATDSDLDPFPTSLLNQYVGVLLPSITRNIINLSLSSGTFPD